MTSLVLAISALPLVACGNQGNPTPSTKDPAILSSKATTTTFVPKSESGFTTLYFIDQQQEIPYLEGEDIVDLFELLLETEVNVTKANKVVTLTRANGSYVTLDFNTDTITWSEFDTFHNMDYPGALYDVVSYEEPNKDLIKRDADADYIRPGHHISVNLKQDFNIEMVYDDSTQKFYLPLQTVNDAFLADIRTVMYYNGEKIFINYSGSLKGFEEEYYSVQPKNYSQAFAEFNYNELCLALELHYGLKEIHDIINFEDVFEVSGLGEKLKNTTPLVVDNAIKEFICKYLDDNHSGFGKTSPYTGKDATLEDYLAPAHMKYLESLYTYKATCGKVLADKEIAPDAKTGGYAPYMKVGDTAYITFDQFFFDQTRDFYADTDFASWQLSDITDAITEEKPLDVMRLIQYAHYQIKHDSEIKNVVVDLSCNGGGAVDVAVYLTSWLLGSCEFSAVNPITGAAYTKSYQADVNLDRQYDENDTLSSDINIYCLISPNSFSCGNLVPALLKSSNKATLIGRTSGGGACAVEFFLTAGGSMFQCSSPIRLSVLKNGSYYHIDQGVEPDHVISNLEHFYDRDYLTNTFIPGLA